VKQHNGTYKGWNVRTLENKLIKLHVAPELGGRIIQLEMNGYEFLFVNPSLFGQKPVYTSLGEYGKWQNFGGEKIWPAPQGWNSPNQWPGPPDPVIDSGAYDIQYSDEPKSGSKVKLTGTFDRHTGLQIERDIVLSGNRSEVTANVTFTNQSNVTRTWSVWPVCQLNTSEISSDNRYKIVCPTNPESRFSRGFKVMHGLVNNPQFKINSSGYLEVGYQYIVGKIGVDTVANWVAFIDEDKGKVFVLKFRLQADQSYPDHTSVQIWTQGKGMIYSRNQIREFGDDRKLNPPYMEIELLSPLQEIHPGKNIKFEYRMLTATIPSWETIKEITEIGIIASPLNVEHTENEIYIKAKYGVFSKGTISVGLKEFPNEKSVVIYNKQVSPEEGIDITVGFNQKKKFKRGSCISVGLFDQYNHFLGELEKTEIN